MPYKRACATIFMVVLYVPAIVRVRIRIHVNLAFAGQKKALRSVLDQNQVRIRVLEVDSRNSAKVDDNTKFGPHQATWYLF